MITWMLYSAFVALFVTGAARAGEWLVRLTRYRVRWIWAGALALTMVLSATAAFRQLRTVDVPIATAATVGVLPRVGAVAGVTWTQALRRRADDLRLAFNTPLRSGVAMLHRVAPPSVNGYAIGLSLLASAMLAALLVAVGRRFRRARHDWPVTSVQGVDVRVASHVGPVVIGFVRPEIVVPRWLLSRRADEQGLVVAHEDEHVRARDPMLLGLAWGAVALMPWNPSVWYMLSRLRLAIELDCDARVLRRGAAPRSYGSLLIDVAENTSALRLSALALADDSSHLHQRILAMKPNVPRFAVVRASVAGTFALVAILAACQAAIPTDADIERMDVATATRTAKELARLQRVDTNVAYMIDGSRATSAEALAIVPSALERVEVVTGKGGPTRILVAKRREPFTVAQSDSVKLLRGDTLVLGLTPQRGARSGGPGGEPLGVGGAPFTGLILIDGVRSTASAMQALNPKRIESIEVIKGAAAAAAYGAEAGPGAIIIRTKSAGGAK